MCIGVALKKNWGQGVSEEVIGPFQSKTNHLKKWKMSQTRKEPEKRPLLQKPDHVHRTRKEKKSFAHEYQFVKSWYTKEDVESWLSHPKSLTFKQHIWIQTSVSGTCHFANKDSQWDCRVETTSDESFSIITHR